MEKPLLIFPKPPETQKNSIKCLRWLIISFEIIHTFRQSHVSKVIISALHWSSSADFKEECDLWQWLNIPKTLLETGKLELERKGVLFPMGICHTFIRRLLEGELIRFSYSPCFSCQYCWLIKTCLLPVLLFTLLCFLLISTLCCIKFIEPFCHL